MPKVIGQDDSIKQRFTCQSCGAINEVYPGEIVILSTLSSRKGLLFKWGFQCEACKSNIVTARS